MSDWLCPGATAWYLGRERCEVISEIRPHVLTPGSDAVRVRSFASGAAPWVPVRDLKQFEEVKSNV